MEITKKVFFDYLLNRGISKKSLKNYKSDLNHFLGWSYLRVQSWGSYATTLDQLIPLLSNKLAQEYKLYLSNNKIPIRTINRRLSTIRHLSRFLYESGYKTADFASNISNINLEAKDSLTKTLEEFEAYLKSQRVSRTTVRNYISDIRQFIFWAQQRSKRSNLE